MKRKRAIVIIVLLAFSFIFIGMGLELSKPVTNNNVDSQVIPYFAAKADAIYLSDIDYIANQSRVGWDKIRYDEVNDGSLITLKVENGSFSFKKGIWAHADSQITYDISAYDYKYFTAFIGLNTTSTRGDGVRFYIYTSLDGENWGEAKYNEIKLPGAEASHINVELGNANYLRLVADKITNSAADYAVYADAKLVNDISESDSSFKTVDEYNEIINSQYMGQADLTGDIEFNLLKRQLINNVGQFTINSFYNESDDNKAALDYLMSNPKALKYYILGGKPLGNNYYKSLTEYSRLYRNYKNDFNNTEVTKYGTVLGDLYLRMATSLSLTHSTLVGLWMNNASTPDNQSDSVRRYAIVRYMHKNGLFQAGGMDYNSWFENYTVEEMRYVMANNIDDQSMLWLNSYVRELIEKEGGARLWPHRYVSYVWPNYANPIYYAEENKDYFNELFSVRDPKNENSGERVGLWDVVYTIPGGVDEPEYNLQIPRGTSDNKMYKVWMNMRNKFGTGAVCGGISKTGANIRGVLGLPDAVVGQPGHAAHINYFQNSKGEGYWGIDNDVSGWAYTGSSILLGWASAPYASGYTGTYIPLAQEVINHEDTYEQSQKFVFLAETYADLVKKEELYRKALEIQPLNLNAWYGLILTYNASDNKTEEQYYELAKEIAEALKFYPLPMYQMTNQIKPKLTSQQEAYKFTLLQTRILKEGSTLPNNSTEVLQPAITRLMANFILGQMDTTIATFSFDGDDAGKIVLSDRFDGNGVRWDYAIKGKGANGVWDVSDFKEVSFSAEEEHKLQLTKEEIASMTAENDLYIHIVGVNYSEENLYKIDINESAGLPSTLFANDLENKLIGAVGAIEWKYNETDNWTRYENEKPELTGDKSITLRMGATGTYLASKTSSTFNFTKDVINNKRKYIPVEHLALEGFSTEAANQQGSATNAIDANYNTRWHSAWNGSDTERYITVKLDRPVYLSAVEFVPAAGGNGKIYDGTVFGSMDGENWIVLSSAKGLTYTNAATTVEQAIENIKNFAVEDPQKVQYVKIVADRTNGNWITARAFNFYEDTTAKAVATFSFDGTNAGKIMLYDEYENTNWRYSIDGGDSWQRVTTNSHKFSKTELEKINSKNKIKITLDGDKDVYTINIKDGEVPEKGYLNDLENRPIAQPEQDKLEWMIAGDDSWTDYSEDEPNVSGNRTLLVRRKATGITSASEAIEYQFSEDNQPRTKKYIPIKHLSIHAYSTQSHDSKRPYYAPNVIDGNPNTEWHTDFRTSIANSEAFITIKIDNPKYISGLDYLHMNETQEPYGFMKTGKVYVSEDGENWKEAAIVQDVAKDDTIKHIAFNKAIYGQYVKLVIESHDNVFAAASVINLYEDKTMEPIVTPTAKVEYSTKDLTNGDVVATLVGNDSNITVTNNGGKNTYTFTKNGKFTFEFVDNEGNKGTAVATVNNIDKTAPVGTVKYSTNDVTNDNVIVTLTANEDITITNNNGKNTYVFTENGTFTFEFRDKAGNESTATAQVTWINKNAPVGMISYDISTLTNKNVIATLKVDRGVTITNNGGKSTYTFTKNGTFTFEFVDSIGNRGTATATVNWIDKVAPTAKIEYSTTAPTNKDVVATLKDFSEEIVILNNNGKAVHTFTKNGTFTFEFRDRAGNKGTAKAIVNNINKVVPTAKVEYSTVNPTNKNVVAKLTGLPDDVVITNNGGKATYTFTDNGTFTFEFRDRAGNEGSVVAIVNNIDRIAPKASITYNPLTLTRQNVVATIGGFSEEVVILNNNGSPMYTFVKNGSFKFMISDKAGNVSLIEAKVDWIDDSSINEKPNTGITKPNKPNKPNKPSFPSVIISNSKGVTVTGGSNYTSKNNSTTNNNNVIKTTEDDASYTLFEVEGVSLKVPTGLWKDGTELKIKYLYLGSTLQKQFGKTEDYFELYTEPDQVNNLDSKSIIMIVDLDPSKEFAGIYNISSKKIEKLKYKDLGNNQIEVKVNGLGKYLVDYKEKNKNSSKTKIAKENSTINLNIGLGVATIILLGGCVTFWFKRRANY